MILLALLLLQAAPAPATDIAVIAARLDRFKAGVKFRDDGPHCEIKTSTGDAEIDRIGCTATTTCFPQFQSRYQATNDRAIPQDTRKVMQSALTGELATCVARQRTTLIAELAAKRAAARPAS